MARILIAENDAKAVAVLQQQLVAQGHHCTVIRSGDQVIDAMQQGKFDLLIVDVMLPGVSGFELCRRMRRSASLYTLPILILSSMDSEEEVFHGLAQGADDYVSKPFHVGQLLQRIDSLLRSHANTVDIDPLTGMHGAESTKREIQRRLGCGEPFAVAYGEVTNVREFSYRYGEEARIRIITAFAQVLQTCNQEFGGESVFSGHMSGGHFVSLLSADQVQAYCSRVREIWQEGLASLYARIGSTAIQRGPASESREKDPRLELDVLFCVSFSDRATPRTPQQLFEILTHLRGKSIEARSGGICLDRRGMQ